MENTLEQLLEELDELLYEVHVVRSKRVPSAEKRKRKRRYAKKKSQLRRLAKRYRKRSRSKRMAKRRAKLRKRLHLKAGSRKRVYLSSREYSKGNLGEQMSKKIQSLTENVKALSALVSKDFKQNMVEAFGSAKVLAESMIKRLKEAKEKETLWCSGPAMDGSYTATIKGKTKTFPDRMKFEEFIRKSFEDGVTVQWKQYEEQMEYELGEEVLPDFIGEEIYSTGELGIMKMLGEEEKPKNVSKIEPKPVEESPILNDLEEVVKTAHKISMSVKNETIDEEEAHEILMKITEYLDKAAHKMAKGA